MSERLQVLHYNVGRQKHVQWTMLSDKAYARFAALAVVEPYLYADQRTGEVRWGSHSSWQPFTPSLQREHSHTQFAYRAMLWVNTVCQAVQVPVTSHDIVAVSIATSAGTALVISAYDPNNGDNQKKTDRYWSRSSRLSGEPSTRRVRGSEGRSKSYCALTSIATIASGEVATGL